MFNILKKKKTDDAELRSVTVAGSFWNIFRTNKPSSYLNISTVYACIRMISDSVAMSPVNVYEKSDKGRDELDNHNVAKLLRNPAKNVTYFKWQNTMMAQWAGWGNAYSVIEWDGVTPVSLIYIPASNVSVQETFNEGEPYYYRVTSNAGRTYTVYPEDMIHYTNISLDGYTGLSPISLHAVTFDRAYYESQFATNFVQRSGSMSGIITTDKKLKPDQIEQLKKDFSNAYGGAENAGKTPVLGDGMKYEQLKPISPADADYVESKKLTKAEIMEIFKVPPPLLGVIDATYNNTEQLALIYQRYTLTPIYSMAEQELTLKLISSKMKNKIFIAFESDALLNATAKDKAEVITKLTEKGVISLNEARRKYNMKSLDGLDEVVLPLNLAPMKLHKEVLTPAEPVEPPPPAEPTEPPEPPEDMEELQRQFHKLSSEVGRLKKHLGNGKP